MSREFLKVPLGDLLIPISRPEPVDQTKIYNILGAHWYAQGLYVKDIKQGTEIQADKVYRIEQGDFVYNRLFAWKGSFAVASQANHNCYVSNEFPCFSIRQDLLDSQYLWRYFSRSPIWNEALGLSTGGTPTSRNRLKEDKLLAMNIILPPLEEQQRIVARIEELAGKIEEARGLRGETVEETQKILNNELKLIVDKNVEQYGLSQLNDLLLGASYGTSIKCTYERPENSLPVLRIPNVLSEKISFEDMKYGILSNAELERILVEVGDLLIVRTNGSADLVGRCAVVHTLSEPTTFASYMIRLKCDRNIIISDYLQLMLKHLRIEGQLTDFARTTAGQYNVSLGRLRTAKVPVPSVDRQHKIVTYLDSLQAKVDALKQLQAETEAELDALLPSLLDRAFKGEL